jgi:hypothetical protein
MSILDQAITPRRPVQRNDDSAVSLLSLSMLNSARRDSSLESTLPPFIPALRIDGQSLPQGKRITSASEGQELHLYANQVIKDIYWSLSPIPDLSIPVLSGRAIRRLDGGNFQTVGSDHGVTLLQYQTRLDASCQKILSLPPAHCPRMFRAGSHSVPAIWSDGATLHLFGAGC